MGKYCGWRNVALLCAGVLLFFSSCTDVDSTLGDTLIPSHQQLKVARMTATGIEAYQVRTDSLLVGGQFHSVGSIGSMKSATLGTTESGWMGQYILTKLSNEKEGNALPEDAAVDSLVLVISFIKNISFGDIEKPQQFNVYRVKERLYFDNLYYCPSNPALAQEEINKIIGTDAPILTFEYNGEDFIKHRIKGTQGDELAKLLVEHTQINRLNDKAFVDHFKGLYVTPSATSPKDAATLLVDLTDSGLILETRPKNHPDSVITATYSANVGTSNHYIASFNLFKHDYAGTEFAGDPLLANKIDILAEKDGLGYVQGAGGVTVALRFSDAFIQSLKDKIIYGETVPAARDLEKEANQDKWAFDAMAIQGAKCSLKLHDPDNSALDRAFLRMGLYTDYSKVAPAPDYHYEEEMDPTYPIELPFGGYLSRSRGCYDIDISRTVQRVISDVFNYSKELKSLEQSNLSTAEKEEAKRKLEEQIERNRTVMLAPAYISGKAYGQGYDLYGQGEALFDFKDLEVKITYTLLNKIAQKK